MPEPVRRLLLNLLAKSPDDRPAASALLPDWLALQADYPFEPSEADAWRLLGRVESGNPTEGNWEAEETLSIPSTAPSGLNPDQELGTALLEGAANPGANRPKHPESTGRGSRSNRPETLLIGAIGGLALVVLALLIWWLA